MYNHRDDDSGRIIDVQRSFDKVGAHHHNLAMLCLAGEKIRKILIIRTSALGDVVHTLPALDALKERFPGARIDWLVEPLGAKLLEGHPKIDKVIVMPRQAWKKMLSSLASWPALISDVRDFAARVRREAYDLVLDFHCGLRSAAILACIGGRHRIGFDRGDSAELGGTWLTTHKAPRAPHRMTKVEKNLLLVRELGFEGPCPNGTLLTREEDRAWARNLLMELSGTGPIVAVHPAVSQFGDIKRWPASYFAELIDMLRSRLDARVLITWGPGELEAAAAVGRPTLLPSAVELPRFAALLEEVNLFIAADTGVLPMACILGTPSVALFGPKDAELYAPYPRRPEIVRSTAPCSPCLLRRCDHRICMALISPAKVFSAVERALAGPKMQVTS